MRYKWPTVCEKTLSETNHQADEIKIPGLSLDTLVQTLSHVQLGKPMDCSMPGLPVHNQLPESTQTHVHQLVIPSNHLILCRLFLLLPSIFPSIRIFSNESALRIRWPKYWSFSFSVSLFSEYSRLISFRFDWFDLLAFQGTLKSLLQHHSVKASVLWLLAFFMV